MSELLAIAFGVIAGVVTCLVPGLHPGLVLGLAILVLPSLIGTAASALAVAAAAGVSLYLKRLNAVYNPQAGGDDVASMEPALRMTCNGQGAAALRLMVTGIDLSIAFGLLLCVVILIFHAYDINAPKALNKLLGPLGIVVILIWIATTISRAKAPGLTALSFVVLGGVGYVVLHHPALVGDRHQLAPIMSGVFGIPIAISVLLASASSLPPQQEPEPVSANIALAIIGVFTGAVTGFLAGLGAGSLVSLLQDLASDDIDYLLLSSSAESSNDVLAMLLILIATMGRSGEAVALGHVAGTISIPQGLAIFGVILFGAAVGRTLTFQLESWYQGFIGSRQPQTWATLVLVIAASQILLMTSTVIAIVLTTAAVVISLWAREKELPLQTSFAALAVPLVLQYLGLVPSLNTILF